MSVAFVIGVETRMCEFPVASGFLLLPVVHSNAQPDQNTSLLRIFTSFFFSGPDTCPLTLMGNNFNSESVVFSVEIEK